MSRMCDRVKGGPSLGEGPLSHMRLFICCLCGAEAALTYTAADKGWDWFTGYFEKTLEFCPTCRHTRTRNELFEASRRTTPQEGVKP